MASQSMSGELGLTEAVTTSTITPGTIHSLYFHFLICKMGQDSRHTHILGKISQENMMKGLCSTQQEVYNCFVFIYVSICNVKKQTSTWFLSHHHDNWHQSTSPPLFGAKLPHQKSASASPISQVAK